MNHLHRYRAGKAAAESAHIDQLQQGLRLMRGQNQPKGLPDMPGNVNYTDTDDPIDYNPATIWQNALTGTGAGPQMPGAEPHGDTN